jgi:putative heme degradation protein
MGVLAQVFIAAQEEHSSYDIGISKPCNGMKTEQNKPLESSWQRLKNVPCFHDFLKMKKNTRTKSIRMFIFR